MRHLLILSAALLLSVESAQAQTTLQRPRYQAPTPTTSPYLNMLRGGNPALNYYGAVRPQTEMNRSLQSLQQQMLADQGQMAPMPLSAPPDPTLMTWTTGHPVSFFNTTHYFPVPGQRPGATSGGGQGQTGAGSANPLSLGLGFGGNGLQPVVNFNRR